MDEIEFYKRKLNLQKLWSHDLLNEFYNSPIMLSKDSLPSTFQGPRQLFDFAYYLLPNTTFCPFHKLSSEESWQFCAGGPLDLFIIEGIDQVRKITIGNDLTKDQSFIHIVPSETWFGAKCSPGTKFTLITHCVSPGFDKNDEKEGYYEEMIRLIPSHSDLVTELSWPRDLSR